MLHLNLALLRKTAANSFSDHLAHNSPKILNVNIRNLKCIRVKYH